MDKTFLQPYYLHATRQQANFQEHDKESVKRLVSMSFFLTFGIVLKSKRLHDLRRTRGKNKNPLE